MRDVRVVETRQHLRLALESREAVGILGDIRRQHLERDLAAELLVLGAPDLAHPAGAELAGDAVVREGRADHRLSKSRLCAQLRAISICAAAERSSRSNSTKMKRLPSGAASQLMAGAVVVRNLPPRSGMTTLGRADPEGVAILDIAPPSAAAWAVPMSM